MILCFICTYTLQMAAQTWIGTWATAPQTVVKAFMPYNNNMTNRSVRQIVKVSVGGDVIRLKLSNIYSMQPVVIRSIYIAHAKDSFKIDAKSAQYFKFGNSYKATIPAGRQIVSDALKFNLKNLERVAITINYTSAPDVPTVHMGSRTTSYIMKGVTNAHSNFEKAFRENHWYNISGIDVYTMSNNMSAIAIMGNSITDGKCSTDNAQNRWPDVMSEMLQLKPENSILLRMNMYRRSSLISLLIIDTITQPISSMTRDIAVAIATPVAPSFGNPKRPKMKHALKNTFSANAIIFIAMLIVTRPRLRSTAR